MLLILEYCIKLIKLAKEIQIQSFLSLMYACSITYWCEMKFEWNFCFYEQIAVYTYGYEHHSRWRYETSDSIVKKYLASIFKSVREFNSWINQKYNMNVIRTETSLKPLRKRLCQESNARLMKLRTLSNRL